MGPFHLTRLLYAGRLHTVSAEPEFGKGWLALAAAFEPLRGGRDAWTAPRGHGTAPHHGSRGDVMNYARRRAERADPDDRAWLQIVVGALATDIFDAAPHAGASIEMSTTGDGVTEPVDINVERASSSGPTAVRSRRRRRPNTYRARRARPG